MRICVLVAVLGLSLAGCSEDQPATGPTVHCFNEQTGKFQEASASKVIYKQNVSTGKVTVTCPVGE
jgi:hypothetical protein